MIKNILDLGYGSEGDDAVIAEVAESAEKKYTDADVDRIINKKYAAWKSEQEKEAAQLAAQVESLTEENRRLSEELKEAGEKAAAVSAGAESLEREVSAYKMGVNPEVVDFAVYKAGQMTKEGMDFKEALNTLLKERPDMFLKKAGFSTGFRQADSAAMGPLGDLKSEIYEKMGIGRSH